MINRGFDDFGVEEILQMANLKRWGIIEMSREQSVAEHTYNVAAMATLIANEVNRRVAEVKPAVNLSQIMAWALVHDLPELETGDLPTPFKSRVRDAVYLYEKNSCPEWFALKESTPEEEQDIVKMADEIDAIIFAQKYCIGYTKYDVIDGIRDRLKLTVGKYDTAHGRNYREIIAFCIGDRVWGV